jgi:hypothetical protein
MHVSNLVIHNSLSHLSLLLELASLARASAYSHHAIVPGFSDPLRREAFRQLQRHTIDYLPPECR